MQLLILILLIVFIFSFGAAFWLFVKKLNTFVKKDDNVALVMLQNQINEISRTLDTKLGESTKAIQRQFGDSRQIIREVTEQLTKIGESNKQVIGFADQLKNLQDILKNPKQRGILGEYYLETALKNILPPGSYQVQYTFKDGVIVDAVIFVQDKIIPIDSKFSLENYNRILEAREPAEKKKYESAFIVDIKNRIDETSKYVKPEENTMDFALMYIPSEAIYYDLLVNKVGAITEDTNSLINYAYKKRVVIVAPTTFGAFLQTVLQGLKDQKISDQAKEIVKQVANLGKHLSAYENYMQKLGKNLGTSVSMYNSAYKEFGKIDKDVLKISGQAIGIEPELLEKPEAVEEE